MRIILVVFYRFTVSSFHKIHICIFKLLCFCQLLLRFVKIQSFNNCIFYNLLFCCYLPCFVLSVSSSLLCCFFFWFYSFWFGISSSVFAFFCLDFQPSIWIIDFSIVKLYVLLASNWHLLQFIVLFCCHVLS